MKRVELIGFDPATVDFSDPALPRGTTAEKIHAGVKLALAIRARQSEGYYQEIFQTGVCHIRHLPDYSDRSGISGRSRQWYQTSSHRSWDRDYRRNHYLHCGFHNHETFSYGLD